MEQETRNGAGTEDGGDRDRGSMGWHAFYLGDHLVLEDLLLVEDLDGDILSGLDVPGELDLGEGAFAEGPAELVPPHTGPAHGRAHLPVCGIGEKGGAFADRKKACADFVCRCAWRRRA